MEEILSTHEHFLKSLDEELLQSIVEYTIDAYKTINRKLREGKSLTLKYKKILDNIDHVFDMIDPITDTITLYRGIKSEGQTKADKAFISTSYDEESALQFAGQSCCLVVFTVPPGSKVLFVESVSEHPEEREVLIDRHGSFSVTLIHEKREEKMNKIFVSYIPLKSVNIKVEELGPVIDTAVDSLKTIDRVLDVFSEGEYELFKDDVDALRSSVSDLYTSISKTEPTASTIDMIVDRLNLKYS